MVQHGSQHVDPTLSGPGVLIELTPDADRGALEVRPMCTSNQSKMVFLEVSQHLKIDLSAWYPLAPGRPQLRHILLSVRLKLKRMGMQGPIRTLSEL